jgi:hypothetical protein
MRDSVTRIAARGLWLIAVLLIAAGCESAGDRLGFSGRPEGNTGWNHDYPALPQDVWEAFRMVVRDNGRITVEHPERLELEGLQFDASTGEHYPRRVRGRVYDQSRDGVTRSRLIVFVWNPRLAHEAHDQNMAYSYTIAVRNVLRERAAPPPPAEARVQTTSEDPLEPDEAVAFFRVTPAQAFAAAREIVAAHGEVEQADEGAYFLRGRRRVPLEQHRDEVRVHVYDRTEGERARVKLSVRVRGRENTPLAEAARGYVAEIAKLLEERHGEG